MCNCYRLYSFVFIIAQFVMVITAESFLGRGNIMILAQCACIEPFVNDGTLRDNAVES